MLNRHRLALAIVSVTALLVASGASAIPPTVTITGRPAESQQCQLGELRVRASETSTFECKLDTGAFESCASPKGYTGSDGSHTFDVKATNAATRPARPHTRGPSTPRRRRQRSLGSRSQPDQHALGELRLHRERGSDIPVQDSTLSCRAVHFATDLDRAGERAAHVRGQGHRRGRQPGAGEPRLDDRRNGADRHDHGQADQPEQTTSARLVFTASETSAFRCKLDTRALALTHLAESLHRPRKRAPHVHGRGDRCSRQRRAGKLHMDDRRSRTNGAITGKPNNPSKVARPASRSSASEASTFRCRLDACACAVPLADDLQQRSRNGPTRSD